MKKQNTIKKGWRKGMDFDNRTAWRANIKNYVYYLNMARTMRTWDDPKQAAKFMELAHKELQGMLDFAKYMTKEFVRA